ncbi:MAG: hypothetical protein FWC06_03185 [Treponema sp.]|nr:hypothetical protein [Treponema sp.]
MRKAGILILILSISLPFLLAAQDGDDPSGEVDWDNIPYELFSRGDRTLIISLGVVLPTVFFNDGKIIEHQIDPPVGGTGSFVLNYFLIPKFTIGGEVGGMFLPTLAGNTLYMIYLGVKAGTQFVAGRFEFPLGLSAGMAWHTYLNTGYFGLYLRASGSAFYRATSNWAFGLTASWFFFPEWTNTTSKNVYGNFVDLTVSARYLF